MFASMEMYNIDVQDFKKFLDLTKIDKEKVSNAMYDREYHGCFNFLCCKCFKCCCRLIRRKMVTGKLKELDQDQKVKTKKYADMFTIVKQV